MKRLLMKELRLAMHPTALLFLLLSGMLLIPNYPYLVCFFYTGLAVFFTCLTGRENHDVFYTLSLPVSRRDVVAARFLFVVLLETAQLLLAIPCAILRQRMPMPGNQVGLDANIALFGFALAMLGLFNLLFFRTYYRNVDRVGTAFLFGSTGVFVYMLLAETAAHAVPFVRDRLDTPDPQFLAEKCAVLAAGAALFVLLTLAAYRRAVRSFEKLDL